MANLEMAEVLRASSAPELAGLRILVVDDNAECAVSHAIVLRLSGHEVEVAHDGPSAVALAQRFEPDVVLLDIGLPGMDGWEVAKLLQEQATEKRPFIIAVADHARVADACHSSEFCIDLHLAKPIDPQKLKVVLARFQRVIR